MDHFFQEGRASVVVGGGFGSEGKGAAAAWLGETYGRIVNIATTNAGAQAGHTTRYRDGRQFICFHLPTIGVVNAHRGCESYINAGSIVDVAVLSTEMVNCNVPPDMLRIHPRAAVITDDDRYSEKALTASTTRLASTQKGVGSAISNKVMRRGRLAGEYASLGPSILPIDLNKEMQTGAVVSVEIPQGTGLSLNHGRAYPECTSRDCWVGAGLNDAGIHPKFLGNVCMVMRTFPIRVGHIFNELGEKLGDSGPFYEDSLELDWTRDFPHLEPERTTVTKRIRRIATWSDLQYEAALSLNRPTMVFLSFCNYLNTADEFWNLYRRMKTIEERLDLEPVHVYNVGPCVEDTMTSADGVATWLKHNT